MGSGRDAGAQRSTLSVTESCIDFEELPSEGDPGTEITATMQSDKPIAVADATTYIAAFVAYLPISVTVNGVVVSGRLIEDGVARLVETWRITELAAEISANVKADIELAGAVTGEFRIDLSNIRVGGSL